MSRGVNKVILVGNLGRDPEIISFDGGVKKASFSMATTEVYRARDGHEMEHTEWHNIVMWRGLAEVAEKFLRKGSQIYVEGRIKNRSYEKDGQKRYITEVECDNLTMLRNRGQSENPPTQDQSFAKGVNKVVLIGNLGRDPELISFDGGAKKASFSIATTEVYRTRDGQDMEQTEWHNIVMWRDLAELAEKTLHKGSQIFVEGRLKNRSYEKDGQKKYVTEIECDNCILLGSPSQSDYPGSNDQSPDASKQSAPPVIAPEDDLPF